MIVQHLTCLLLVANLLLGFADAAFANPLGVITPGTSVGDESATRWNRVVLLATPMINSGDTDKVGDLVRSTSSKFTLTILATVSDSTNSTSSELTKQFQLDEVGVGYSLLINGKQTVVSAETAGKLGAALTIVTRQVLSENEQQLALVEEIVRTSTVTIFDSPSLVFRNGTHEDLVMRHLVWIDAKSGQLTMLVWMMKKTGDQLSVLDEPLRIVAAGTVEQRKVHVDGKAFVLGIPTKKAFALEGLPPGKLTTWSLSARNLAGLGEYNQESLRQLTQALNEMLQKNAQ